MNPKIESVVHHLWFHQTPKPQPPAAVFFILKETDNLFIEAEGKADSNGQEHLYIETQGAYTLPMENGAIKIYSSTPAPIKP